MAEDTLPQTDDMSNAGQTEQELLDAVMRNSPIAEELGVPLPTEETGDVDPVETDDEDPESEEVVSEDVEEIEETEEEEVPEADGAEEAPTQDEAYSLDDLEDFQVMVKIDGEETAVDIQELVKGYSTDASLSKKGRELGEARKELEAEREVKLQELDQAAAASNALLTNAENSLAKQYHDLEAQVEKARKDGDTYEMNDLKDKREQVQKNYWNARNRREELIKQVAAQNKQQKDEQFNQQIQNFQEVIPTMIPDFSPEVGGKIRDFAIEKGISSELLETLVDPVIIKFIDDFRRLDQGVSKGVAKRKAVVVKKAVPTKKAKAPAKKKEDAEKMRRARAFKEDASPDDQMAFLRDYASKSLKL